ncbi:GGDEF domain-containing protein [Shewanella nanhaiensis]|uniref:GGDEF domain-containing protein n=1 Tax=Shewanella nanhaiensis TaxID=2864872 RepID=A0ABS7E0G1_9GAMM|nr:GGDEF domain-containing protein [Shewanella nanhaiensis]MBW8183189.1 GGDEF domain-containing protein [Shewanella nanhaiensis]
MKRKLFLLLSSPVNDFENRVYTARIARYFSQSIRNSSLLLMASLVLSFYQFYLDSSLILLAIWQSIFAVTIIAVYLIDKNGNALVAQNADYPNLRKKLTQRFFFGLLIALLFGISPFILLGNVPLDHVQLYYIFLICLFAIILISNISFPEYYIAYGILILPPILLHALTRFDDHSQGVIAFSSFFLLIGVLLMSRKSIEMSKSALNEVVYSITLKDQMLEMMEMQELIEHQAHHDELTGLANRRKFEEEAVKIENRAKNFGGIFGLIYVDLDKFKPINDTYGHQYGDWVLQEIAKRITSCTRETDLVCRMGGDEFCVLIQNVTDKAELEHLSGLLKNRIKMPFAIDGIDFKLGASMGAAIYPADGKSVDSLVSSADHKMYAEKKATQG